MFRILEIPVVRGQRFMMGKGKLGRKCGMPRKRLRPLWNWLSASYTFLAGLAA